MIVLAIVGSVRKGGNTDLIIDRILAGAKSRGAETEKIYVDDLNFGSCQGCYECRRAGVCRQKDDVAEVKAKIDAADAVVIGSPLYGNYMTGQLKLLLDRLMGIINEVRYTAGEGLKSISRLTPKKRNMVAVIGAAAPHPEAGEDAFKLLRRMLAAHANGDFYRELMVNYANRYGQVAMGVEELKKIMAEADIPGGEEAARRLSTYYQKVLADAYQLGEKMVSG
ncbi:MAG: hypothetical protein PWQ91_1142 [Eubacteriales bacterium]|nr:hypothetical protein [Eubacteriales bacterium]MDN5364081.1 hypothetical protein [Eubacteriales bacterium]